jgi:membrane fusion protein (multidrug efflux system)
MRVSEAEPDTPNQDQQLPRDFAINRGDQGENCVLEGKGEKSDPKPDEQQQKPKQNEEPKQGKDDSKAPRRLPKWPVVLGALVMAAFIGAVLWIIYRPRPDVWTNDAYVRVHYASIAPRISGQVSSVPVDDNDSVKVGQVLVTLDPRDYQTAVASAEATLERDTAQHANVAATLARQPAIISEQEAQVALSQARLAFTEPDARRYSFLAATNAGTIQQKQQADSALQQSQAQLNNAQAALDAARRDLDIIKAQERAAQAVVDVDKALLEQAKLNLSYTRILAPVDGVVDERSVEVGNIVAPGTTLMTVVPLNRVYLIANYLETDLTHVRAGQRVTIHVDAYNIDLDGVVNGVGAASGATYAPLPPVNATGNFTKIVQRLPVKVDLLPNQPLAKLLRVGFSVETTIHTGLANVVEEQLHSTKRVTEH